MCRKALRDTGLQVIMVDSIEAAMRELSAKLPLAVVIADGWEDADARELLVEVRAAYEKLPILLIEDPGSDIVDEEAARRRGATRLFLRPVELDAVADAIEKLAVEAEMADDVSQQLDEVSQPAPVALAPEWEGTNGHAAAEPAPERLPRATTEIIGPPPRAPAPEPAPPAPPLLRADEALGDEVGLGLALSAGGELVVQVRETPPPPSRGELSPPPREPAPFVERSTIARRLDDELSAVERRLFPGSTPPLRRYEDDDEPLGDIDLDALAIDTLPGMAVDKLDAVLEPVPLVVTRPFSPVDRGSETAPGLRFGEPRPGERPIDQPTAPPIPEEGDLDEIDIAELLCGLHASGFTGCLALHRGEQERHLYFDAGMPVFATSSFVHDRLGDMLYREGKLTREQHKKTRELIVEPGRKTATVLVELGMLKPNEIFPALRRHVEEIVHSCFAWESGRYRLGPEQPAPEDRLRLAQPPWAVFLEGVRRKYGLERLVDLLGPLETVLSPTTILDRALADAGLTDAERAAAELLDGERSLAGVLRTLEGLPGTPISEAGLYALCWGLVAMGAARVGAYERERLGVRAAATVVTGVGPARERRRQRRDGEEGPQDRAIDKERIAAKRAQIADADYFAVLGLDRHASAYEIARAHERLRADFAPERFSEELRAEAAEALAEIHEVLDEAHRVLMDEAVRHAYREHLRD